MADEWVTIESTFGIIQAEILRGLLQAKGIDVRLSQESAGTAIGLSVGRLGRVDLLVPSDQVEPARSILADYHSGRLEDEGVELESSPESEDEGETT
jgi:hypothetical protein